MDQVTYAVRDNRAVWAGRSLREWVPDLVNVIVGAFDPEKVILFGSVADGTDGPDSYIDLLVVLSDARSPIGASSWSSFAVPPERSPHRMIYS